MESKVDKAIKELESKKIYAKKWKGKYTGGKKRIINLSSILTLIK